MFYVIHSGVRPYSSQRRASSCGNANGPLGVRIGLGLRVTSQHLCVLSQRHMKQRRFCFVFFISRFTRQGQISGPLSVAPVHVHNRMFNICSRVGSNVYGSGVKLYRLDLRGERKANASFRRRRGQSQHLRGQSTGPLAPLCRVRRACKQRFRGLRGLGAALAVKKR